MTTTRAFAAVLFSLVIFGCASAMESYPRRACLFGPDHRAFDIGTIVARRDDGARLFKFDDSSRGDHGFMWIAEDDDRHRLQLCTAATLTPVSAVNLGGFDEHHR
jgi:hypothetical protein